MNSLKKILVLILTFVLVVGIVPSYAFDVDEAEMEGALDPGYPLTYHDEEVEAEIPKSYYSNDVMPTKGTLPSSYTSVGKYTTAAKNQNPYGTCWANSATAVAETSMYKYMVDNGYDDPELEDMSVLQLVNYFYNVERYDPLGNLTGDKTINGDEPKLDQGGNNVFTMWGLASWVNAIPDANLPYTSDWFDYVDLDNGENLLGGDYAQGYIGHLQNAYMIPCNDSSNTTARNNIKQAIMDYGSVACSYYHSGSYMSSKYAYYTTTTGSNHAVTIVGWNDDYPASNFNSSSRPSANGAWLVRNSWGTSWGTDGDANSSMSTAQGYFWLSYYDKSLASTNYVFAYLYEPADNYQYNYQYDGSCGKYRTDPYYKAAAIYTVDENASYSQSIDAVGVGLYTTDVTGTVYVYKNPTAGKPESGTKVASQAFSTKYSGFYTVKLDNPPEMEPGDSFSVVVACDSKVSFYFDQTYDNGDWIKFTADYSNDKTYVMDSSTSVYDCAKSMVGYYYGNSGYKGTVRVKAYANDVVAEYTVSYDANGGEDAPSVQGKRENKALTLSSKIPTRTGYVFLGWSTIKDGEVVYQPGDSYTANSDVTLYAVWAEGYTITYIGNNKTVKQMFAKGSNATIANSTVVSKSVSNYQGWSTKSGSEKTVQYLANDQYSGNTDITLYLCSNTHRIVYDANGGSGGPRATFSNSRTITLSTEGPSREGYTFDGWSTTKDSKNTKVTNYKVSNGGSKTVYALWSEKTYIISYDANGGSGAPGNQTKNMNQSINLSSTVPTKLHYTFKGWATSQGGEVVYQPGASYSANADLKLYAVWEAKPFGVSISNGSYIIDPGDKTGAYRLVLCQKDANGKVISTPVLKTVNMANEADLTGQIGTGTWELYFLNSLFVPVINKLIKN